MNHRLPLSPRLASPWVDIASACLAFLAGLAVFIMAFGVSWIDPRNVTWLLRGDWSQHYLGWEAFRNDEWRWPPGRNLGVAAPMGTTVVFTDSLPLFALLLKPFADWLARPMQYQGAWMALSWGLQGLFAYLFLNRLLADRLLALMGVVFFLLLPSLFFRIGHDTLVAQWLILAALTLYTFPLNLRAGAAGAGLISVAVLVHAYLALMVLAIWGAWWFSQLIVQWAKVAWRQRAALLGYPFVVFVWTTALLYLSGYFAAGGSLAAPGYGTYTFNLNALINPMDQAWYFLGNDVVPDWSRSLPPLPRSHENQYEGFNYLGVGILVMVGWAVGVFFWRLFWRLRGRGQWPLRSVPGLPRPWFLLLALLPLGLWAVSNRVGLGGAEWFTYPLPWLLSEPDVQSVFRATGRLAWPLVLVLVGGVLLYLARRVRRAVLLWLLPLLAFWQAYDQYPAWQTIRAAVNEPPPLPLQSPHWDRWIKQASHIAILPPRFESHPWLIDLSARALPHGVTMNSFLISRYDPAIAQAQAEQQVAELRSDGPRPDTLYILEAELLKELPESLLARVQQVDEHWVIPPRTADQLGGGR